MSLRARLAKRLTATAFGPHLPRRTVRLRLTLIYGFLFLLSGAALLVTTNLLVDRATSFPRGNSVVVVYRGKEISPAEAAHVKGAGNSIVYRGKEISPAEADQIRADVFSQRDNDLHSLFVYSLISFGAMALLSTALGWVVAGRALRPLRALNAAAQDISATSLGSRLPLDGPDDELKELGTTFNQLLARLEKSFESQRRFVANASHELRSPLARQRAIAQVALSDPGATLDSLRAAHERVMVAGAQQERLINALLTLARGEAGPDRQEALDLAADLADIGVKILQMGPPNINFSDEDRQRLVDAFHDCLEDRRGRRDDVDLVGKPSRGAKNGKPVRRSVPGVRVRDSAKERRSECGIVTACSHVSRRRRSPWCWRRHTPQHASRKGPQRAGTREPWRARPPRTQARPGGLATPRPSSATSSSRSRTRVQRPTSRRPPMAHVPRSTRATRARSPRARLSKPRVETCLTGVEARSCAASAPRPRPAAVAARRKRVSAPRRPARSRARAVDPSPTAVDRRSRAGRAPAPRLAEGPEPPGCAARRAASSPVGRRWQRAPPSSRATGASASRCKAPTGTS